MPNEFSALHALLWQQLLASNELDRQVIAQTTSGVPLEVPDTGTTVSSAYEHLRNAAEYAEEHLLLQKAIKRFFKRNLLIAKRHQRELGLELVVDLTQAGYLQGQIFGKDTASALQTLIDQYMEIYRQLRQARITREAADNWTLALLSTDAENLLSPHNVQRSTLILAYNFFLQAMPADRFGSISENDSYELCLYIAVHQAILRSDIDIVRQDIHRMYQQSTGDITAFIRLSQRVDELYTGQLTQTLKRMVGRYGAPFRILRSLNNEQPDVAGLLHHKQQFLDAYRDQIDREYRGLKKRLTNGLIKSVVFIIITKLLIGVAVEIPYDMLLYGSVMVLPLTVNLLFPPLYMVSLMAGLRVPSETNKHAIHQFMEQLLYSDVAPLIHAPKQRRTTIGAKLGYALLFIIPVACTILLLRTIGFNIVQMIIFFTFFSTASFLGFRLSTMIRDLELLTKRTKLLSSLQNFFYLPYVVAGQWLSRKYSRINIVARFLDIMVELPLKTTLRLIHQWMNFLRERYDELY